MNKKNTKGSNEIVDGGLYLVATPIGNLGDISIRALDILKEVDLIAAEDTRVTLRLLNHFNISKTLISYHEHNKVVKGNYLIEELLKGTSVALVTDAGTPGISDPGEDLVKLAIENNIKVIPIPGSTAMICGLISSGLPTGRFVFEGFLPMNKADRKQQLQDIKDETRTIILYEAPHKLLKTLKNLFDLLGDRTIVLARELTKKYEEFIRLSLSQAIVKYEVDSPRGEFVIIISGRKGMLGGPSGVITDDEIIKVYNEFISNGIEKKDAIKKTAVQLDVKKRDVYQLVLELK